MTDQSLLSKPYHILPAQVWGSLTAKRRARVIRLMAKLALLYMSTQIEVYRKEADDVASIGSTQSTS